MFSSNSAGLASDNVLTLAHSTGNVGIGTTNTSEKLTVAGNATFAGSITTNLSSEGTYFTGGSGGIRQLSITSGTNSSAHALHTFNIASTNGKYEFNVNGTTQLSLDSSSATFAGNVTVSGGDITASNAITGVSGGSFRVKNNGGTTIATFNDALNATFAGTISVQGSGASYLQVT